MKRTNLLNLTAALLLVPAATLQACDLQVSRAWIRQAPPAASSLAAYATLRNTGAKPLVITSLNSAAAGMTMLHETTIDKGVAQMRMLDNFTLAPGAKVVFAPGGKHIMLTGPKKAYAAGEHITISFTDGGGCVTDADFLVKPITAD